MARMLPEVEFDRLIDVMIILMMVAAKIIVLVDSMVMVSMRGPLMVIALTMNLMMVIS